MSSIIKVDQIQLADGSTPTAGDLGLNTTGAVLQVVEGTGGAGETITTNTSYVATGCKVSITPSSTTSKVLVIGSGGFNDVATANKTMIFALYKNSASLKDDITRVRSGASGADTAAPLAFTFLDSPSTTSSVEYEVYIKATTGTTIQFNNGTVTQARLCLMEIAG